MVVPHWVLNEYENHSKDSEKEINLTELIRTHLKDRVKLRLAGDLHHYTRHVPLSTNPSASDQENKNDKSKKPVLIVSGGGGAVSSCIEPEPRIQSCVHPFQCFFY